MRTAGVLKCGRCADLWIMMPDGMWHLSRQPIVFERRHEADNSLRGLGRDDCDIGVAGRRVVRHRVDAASPANDLAAVYPSLEDDTWHTERFEVACSYDPVPLEVLKQSLDLAGCGHNRFGRVLRILCRNMFWQMFRNLLAPVWTDCPLVSKFGHSSHSQVGSPAGIEQTWYCSEKT